MTLRTIHLIRGQTPDLLINKGSSLKFVEITLIMCQVGFTSFNKNQFLDLEPHYNSLL